MRWTVFAFVAYVMLAVELGLRRLFAVGSDQIAPSFMLIYMVFIASLAPSSLTALTALLRKVLFFGMGFLRSAELIAP